MDSNEPKQSFWTTLPGILTSIAAIIGFLTGLLVAFGIVGPHPNLPPIADAGERPNNRGGRCFPSTWLQKL